MNGLPPQIMLTGCIATFASEVRQGHIQSGLWIHHAPLARMSSFSVHHCWLHEGRVWEAWGY